MGTSTSGWLCGLALGFGFPTDGGDRTGFAGGAVARVGCWGGASDCAIGVGFAITRVVSMSDLLTLGVDATGDALRDAPGTAVVAGSGVPVSPGEPAGP